MKKYSRKELIEAINRQKEAVNKADIDCNDARYQIVKCCAIISEMKESIKAKTVTREEFERVLFARKTILAKLEIQLAQLEAKLAKMKSGKK